MVDKTKKRIHSRDLKTRRLAWDIVKQASLKNKQLKEVLTRRISNCKDQDKRFITEIVQGSVRMKGRIDWEISNVFKGKITELRIQYLILLRIGVYQVRYMDGVPDYAAVATTVQLAKGIHENLGGLTNALLRAIIANDIPEPPNSDSSIEFISNYYSHPEWIINKWISEYGYDKTVKLADTNNNVPQIWFRVNTLTYTNNDFTTFLVNNEIDFFQFEYIDEFFAPTSKIGMLLNSELFADGKITVQDPSSGLVVKLLNPISGETIIDGCSAPGGKMAYAAQLMMNKGKILSYDENPERLKKISETIERLHINIVEPDVKDLKIYDLPIVSKMLIDVPCTGTGVLSKRADLRWRRGLDDILEMHLLQRKILWQSAKSIKPGGTLVYSTCSLEYEENWMVVEAFLKAHSKFKIDDISKEIPEEFIDDKGAMQTFPPRDLIDGVFAVRLIKND